VNHPAILLWSLICLFVFALIFFPYADGYSLKILESKLKDKPLVCFYDVPPNFKWASYKAIHIWNHALEKYDYPDRITYKHIAEPFNAQSFNNNCNMHIRFVDVIIWGGEETTWRGVAPCNPDFCTIQITTKDRVVTEKVRTIAHEIGHGLSLEHIRADTPAEALALPCSNNVMWEYTCNQLMPKVNEMVIRALECVHAEDGFGGNYNAHCERLVFGKDII